MSNDLAKRIESLLKEVYIESYIGWSEKLEKLLSEVRGGGWQPISEIPTDDGKLYWVYAWDRANKISPEYKDDYPPMVTTCKWHPDAGWCVCDLREVTHAMSIDKPGPPTTPEVMA